MRFILTGGQVHDATQAMPLLTGIDLTPKLVSLASRVRLLIQ